MSNSNIRLDRGNVLSMKETPEGYLRGEAIVSRTGVFPYRNFDGTTRWELRHPDDILTQETLDSIKQIPVTLEHPSELVTADSARDLQVGHVGDNVRIDGPNIIASFTITAKDAVEQIKAGKRGLSLGYRVSDLIHEDGQYNGQSYTHRQTGTIVNHLAVVQAGRVGPSARINLDGASVQIETDDDNEENHMSDVKTVAVNLDGLEYQAAPEVAKVLTKEAARADAAEADLAKVRADHTAAIDALQAKLDEAAEALKARGDEAIAKQVKERVSLIAEASTLNLDAAGLAAKAEREIMEAAIHTKYDGLDLSGKSDDYVRARYDSVMEAAKDKAASKQIETTTKKRGDAADVKMDAMSVVLAAQSEHFKKGA